MPPNRSWILTSGQVPVRRTSGSIPGAILSGLRELRWHAAEISPEGLGELGRQYWADFLEHPPVAFIECVL